MWPLVMDPDSSWGGGRVCHQWLHSVWHHLHWPTGAAEMAEKNNPGKLRLCSQDPAFWEGGRLCQQVSCHSHKNLVVMEAEIVLASSDEALRLRKVVRLLKAAQLGKMPSWDPLELQQSRIHLWLSQEGCLLRTSQSGTLRSGSRRDEVLCTHFAQSC